MNRREVILNVMTLTAAASSCLSHRAMALELPYTVRLLGGTVGDKDYVAGLEIILDEGWKTYWRMPGEAGVPPDFDWRQSKNVASVEVLFPYPHRFVDGGGEGVGYKSEVLFPIRVVPQDFAAPVELSLTLSFAVCKDVCIPGRAMAKQMLGISSALPSDIASVEAALRKVPLSGKAFDSAAAGVIGDHPALVLRPLAGVEVVDVFVESDSGSYFRSPRKGEAGKLFLPVDGLKTPEELRGNVLTLTATTSAGALEQRIVVD